MFSLLMYFVRNDKNKDDQSKMINETLSLKGSPGIDVAVPRTTLMTIHVTGCRPLSVLITCLDTKAIHCDTPSWASTFLVHSQTTKTF